MALDRPHRPELGGIRVVAGAPAGATSRSPTLAFVRSWGWSPAWLPLEAVLLVDEDWILLGSPASSTPALLAPGGL